jgi:hypothetical protein
MCQVQELTVRRSEQDDSSPAAVCGPPSPHVHAAVSRNSDLRGCYLLGETRFAGSLCQVGSAEPIGRPRQCLVVTDVDKHF